MLVSLDGSPGASGAYAVAMQQVDGPTIELGTLQLADGHGVLARSVPVDAAMLTTMLMYGEDGKVLYEAPLTDQVVTFQPRVRSAGDADRPADPPTHPADNRVARRRRSG